MQILRFFIGFNTVSLRIYTCVLLGCAGGCAELRGWLLPDEGGKEVSPEAWGGLAGLEFLGLARCVGMRVGRGQAQKPSP